MAQRQPTHLKLTPKQQALRDLEEARSLIGTHISLTAEAWRPRELIRQSVQKHVWAWAAAAGVGGLLLLRVFVPSRRGKNDRDISSASDRKKGFLALLMQPVLGMVRQSALKYGTQFFQTYLTNQLSRHESTRSNVPDDTSAHV